MNPIETILSWFRPNKAKDKEEVQAIKNRIKKKLQERGGNNSSGYIVPIEDSYVNLPMISSASEPEDSKHVESPSHEITTTHYTPSDYHSYQAESPSYSSHDSGSSYSYDSGGSSDCGSSSDGGGCDGGGSSD